MVPFCASDNVEGGFDTSETAIDRVHQLRCLIEARLYLDEVEPVLLNLLRLDGEHPERRRDSDNQRNPLQQPLRRAGGSDFGMPLRAIEACLGEAGARSSMEVRVS